MIYLKLKYICALLLLVSFTSTQVKVELNDNFKEQEVNKKSISLISWNIRDLGRTKDASELIKIAKLIKNHDIVAIQEVVAIDPAGIQAVAKIVDNLNRMGAKWDYSVSNPTKSPSSYISERYAFLWKTSKVSLKGKPYLDSDLEQICYREPFIGNFKIKGKEGFISIINFHSKPYNKHPEAEIKHLSFYKQKLNNQNIIIAGDFNTNENNTVWIPFFKKGYKNALSNTPTTLKYRCKFGNYLNHSIDNIFYSKSIEVIKSGSIDFVLNCENLDLARGLSDHLPVYIKFKLY